MRSKIKKLSISFFERKTPLVAKELIGKILVVRKGRVKWVTRIIETEAYRTSDPASHSARGLTDRCAPMFEKPAHAYVYFIYGVHEMLNLVTEPEGTPGAVLIRALELISGPEKVHLNGPGKLTKSLGIDRKDNRAGILGGRFEVLDDGVRPPSIAVTPRVGIKEEVPYRPWRFFWKDHSEVSKSKENRNILKVLKK
jgi:DNA-3-methyladenine glycosylase